MPALPSFLRIVCLCALSLLAVSVYAQASVIVAPVKLERLADPIRALGTLRANESASLTVVTTDTISAIHFDDGQRVSAGDVLVELSSGEQQADREAARADVAEARRQFERARELAERGTVSASTLDQRRRELETAQARLEAAGARLGNRRIVAPFDGVVGLRNVSVGSLLTPGTVVTTLHDDSRMKLDFSVPEIFLAQVREGLRVEARSRAYPDQTFTGEVVSVSNEVDRVTRAFSVRAMLPNPERQLRPGMLMTVSLQSREREALVIPEEALITRARTHHVFVIDDSEDTVRVRRRTVEIGARQPGQVEILDGLEAGERVVAHGGMSLDDGDAVSVRAELDDEQSLSEVLAERAGGDAG